MIVGYVSSDIKESDDDVDDWDFLSMGMFDVTFEISGILYETTYDIVTVVKFLHEKYRCCFNSEPFFLFF